MMANKELANKERRKAGNAIEPKFEHAALTEQIIGAAIEVHRQFGPGFLESIYENALVYELGKRRLSVERQLEVPVFYDQSVQVGFHRLDLFVARTLKTISDFEPIHFSVVRSYLRAVRCKHGLLLNFAAPLLGIKRVILE